MNPDLPSKPPDELLRPRDLALLLLASRDLLPRQRARDQQADLAGMQLKRDLLTRLAGLDPEPEMLEAGLVQIIGEMGRPTGPARALAAMFREEWQTACVSPEWLAQLIGEATQVPAEDRRHGPSPRQ